MTLHNSESTQENLAKIVQERLEDFARIVQENFKTAKEDLEKIVQESAKTAKEDLDKIVQENFKTAKEDLDKIVQENFKTAKEDLDKIVQESAKTAKDNINNLSEKIEIISDKITMCDTQISAVRANAQYSPYRPISIGPTGHAISETRSRWKRGWFHSL